MNYASWQKALEGERLPLATVDVDAFDRNLEHLATIAKAAGKTVRLATKSIRVPELIRRAIAGGAPFQGLMCYAVEEAAFLASEKFDDFLIAYPTVQPSDLKILRALVDSGAKVALVVDNLDQLALLAPAMKGARTPLRIVVEMDMSLRFLGAHLGVRRSPVRTIADLSALLEATRAFPELKAVGVMAYEAQVAGLGDRNPFKKLMNPVFELVRQLSVRKIARTRARVPGAFEQAGLALEIFNGGGTGSFDFASREPALTEITAGSALLCSHLFDYYSNIRFEPSAFFALQATRSSDEDYITCLGGGYIASGSPGWDKVPVPVLPPGLELLSNEGAGEVQTPLKVEGGIMPEPGMPVLFRHAKAGELAERFNEYLLVAEGAPVARVKTYRGLGLCFL
ncbi:MAG TPA: alanine racemase [Bdellovibrionota bacterium]|nr:alanine racemase [Bdellovibrionota bacterium]